MEKKKYKQYTSVNKTFPDSEIKLAFAWLENKETPSGVAKKLKLHAPANAYAFVASRLKYAREKGMI